jgi:protein-S-isoprenylcysteine O-methyltransferase Ste14
MDVWIAKAVIIAATVVMIAIRAPHGQRSRSVKTAKSFKGGLEKFLLFFVWFGFLVPFVWIASPYLAVADYPLHWIPLLFGSALLVLGLWVFHRSHADLGTNWSITLEVRESHQLIVNGIYRRVRHPMYLSLWLYCIGQALVLPNWIAGPTYLVAFGLLYALRVGAEERMLLERFGREYQDYMARTKRLVPGLW